MNDAYLFFQKKKEKLKGEIFTTFSLGPLLLPIFFKITFSQLKFII